MPPALPKLAAVSALDIGNSAWQICRSGVSRAVARREVHRLTPVVTRRQRHAILPHASDPWMVLKVLTDAREVPPPTGIPKPLATQRASPTPDCMSSFGVWIAPSDDTTSHPAATPWVDPS